ncbi:hypothetical protein H9P43_010095 [Blastocladiella emersonii ATCC 22665]|nr:hypothetical protein H9P43_010073 [Blastocladiella emersonii ATCC 22665]KAI9148614.1 hypothetical protein H9P43_010095 [Blastocladiella emersonii ATCC 22665]
MNMTTTASTTTGTAQWPHPITSYDVHIYWLPSSKAQRAEAMALKDTAAALFPQLWHGKMWDRPVGPHPYSMFEIDIHNCADFAAFVPWLALHHGSLSVLIHPQTGDDVADHTKHALWLGQPVPLDIGLLAEFQQKQQAAATTEAGAASS